MAAPDTYQTTAVMLSQTGLAVLYLYVTQFTDKEIPFSIANIFTTDNVYMV